MAYVMDWGNEEMRKTYRLEKEDLNTSVKINRDDANFREKTVMNLSRSVTMKFCNRLCIRCKEMNLSEVVRLS